MQVTARFVIATILIQTVLGFALAWLIDKKFRGHGMWTIILLPMMLSPAVVGNFWTFLYQPQIGLQLRRFVLHGDPAPRRSRCSAT